MEPNNMGTAPVEANPVAPTAAPAETAPVTPAAPVVPAPEKKKSHGAVIAAVLFAVLAIGGIGFGVWAMMDGNTQKENYDKQISDLKAQNSKLLDQIAEGGDGVECDDGDDDAPSVNSGDYIYIGEWGIKIKKPENWRDSVEKYIFYNGYPQAVDSLEIRERKNSPGAGVAIMVGGASCDTQVASEHGVCFVVDGKVIIVNELVGEITLDTGSSISETFKNHFMNADNYSKI